MFETSQIPTASSHRYPFLTLSLAAHGCAIVAVLSATLAHIDLPIEAPRQMSTPIFVRPVALPPAAGTSQGQPPKPKPARSTAPAVPVAPRTIPDQVEPPTTTITTPDTTTTTTDTAAGGGSTLGTGKDEGLGVPDGEGTDANGIGSGVPLPITGDVKAPIVVQRVLPIYPQIAIRGHMNGWVIVECIIDRTGHIRDAKVIKSSFAAFEQPALEAVEQWVFTPGTLHGQAVDTIFDLTVTFQIVR